MTTMIWVDERPLRQRLTYELEQMAQGLKELEKRVDEYFSRDLPQYQSWLNHHFSEKLSDIAGLEKKIHSLGHHIEESIQVSLKMNLNPQDLFANMSEEEVLSQIYQDDDLVEPEEPLYSADFFSESHGKEKVSEAVREIYRRIVRCIHPDLRGAALTENETNLWVKAQQAYARNDAFELCRLERCLKCGAKDEPLSCSDMLEQIAVFQKRYEELEGEVNCLMSERAWQFSERKSIGDLEKLVSAEFQGTLRELKSKEEHLHKTLTSWIHKTPAPANKPRKKAPKSQQSLF